MPHKESALAPSRCQRAFGLSVLYRAACRRTSRGKMLCRGIAARTRPVAIPTAITRTTLMNVDKLDHRPSSLPRGPSPPLSTGDTFERSRDKTGVSTCPLNSPGTFTVADARALTGNVNKL